MARKHVDRVVLALVIVMAVLLYLSTADYPGIAQKTSAYYVKFLAVFIGLLSVIQLGWGIMRDDVRGNQPLHITGYWPRFLGLLAALIVFAIVFEHLGFFLSAGIFIPVVALLLGYRNYVTIVLTTISVLIFVYLVFVKLLSVNLPGFNF